MKENKKGITPLVAVILMIAITIVVAATICVLMGGVGEKEENGGDTNNDEDGHDYDKGWIAGFENRSHIILPSELEISMEDSIFDFTATDNGQPIRESSQLVIHNPHNKSSWWVTDILIHSYPDSYYRNASGIRIEFVPCKELIDDEAIIDVWLLDRDKGVTHPIAWAYEGVEEHDIGYRLMLYRGLYIPPGKKSLCPYATLNFTVIVNRDRLYSGGYYQFQPDKTYLNHIRITQDAYKKNDVMMPIIIQT